MFQFFEILSGVALILFGVRFLRKGLDRLLGTHINQMIQYLSLSRLRACGMGLGLGIMIPSSTSISVLLLGPVQSGQLKALNVFPFVLGANIGLTLLVVLATLPLEQAMPVMIFTGMILFQFSHHVSLRGFGQTLLGLGFVMLGVLTIKKVGTHLDNAPDMIHIVEIAGHYPLMLAMIAAVLSVIFQSSTAAILMLLGLGAGGTVQVQFVIPVVLGANLGVEFTRMMVGWQVEQAKRMTFIVIVCKLVVAGILAVTYEECMDYIIGTQLSFALIACLTHTGYNILTCLIGLLFGSLLFSLLDKILPVTNTSDQVNLVRYLRNDLLESPGLALGQSLLEINRGLEQVRIMLDDAWWSLKTSNLLLAKEVSKRDDQIDQLDRQVKAYLTKVASNDLDCIEAREQMFQLRLMSETESIGDVIDKNLCELVAKKIRNKITFTDEEWNDLQQFFGKVRGNMVIAQTASQTRDRQLAQQLLQQKDRLSQFHHEMEERHLLRLNTGISQCQQVSAIYMDILSNLKRINSCVCHMAYAILLTLPIDQSRPTDSIEYKPVSASLT